MRFGEKLRYNANTEWWEQYLRYSVLKKRIKAMRVLRRRLVVRDPNPSSPRRFSLSSEARERTSSESGTHPLQAESSDDEDEAPAPVHRSASRAVLAGLDRLAGAEAIAESSSTAFTMTSRRALLPTLTIDGGADSDGTEDENIEEMTDDALKQRFWKAENAFVQEVEAEVRKIERFYTEMVVLLPQVSDRIEKDATALQATAQARLTIHSQSDERSPLLQQAQSINRSAQASNLQTDFEMQFRDIKDLLNFCDLNSTGLSKILKKHDKYCGVQKRTRLLSKFEHENQFFRPQMLHALQARNISTYAGTFTGGDESLALRQLEQWDKRLVTFDKDTLWRNMLRKERKVSAFHYDGQGAPGSVSDPHIGPQPKSFALGVAIFVFVFLMVFPKLIHALPPPQVMGKYSSSTLDAASRCSALLSLAVILWATEALPLYVTSLLIIPGASLLQLYIGKDGNPVSASSAAHLVFRHMSSSTIMLVICVYALGAALSKFGIDKTIATKFMSGLDTELLVVAVLCLSVLLSIFVSNVAAPVLLISVLLPQLQDMPNSARPCVRCILFSVMVGSNVGGFASPISSPQSAVALGLLAGRYRISFLQWFFVSIPLCVSMLVFAWFMLRLWFGPAEYRLPPLHRLDQNFNWRHYTIVVTVSVTVLFWSIHGLSDAFGSAGMVAAVPLVVFFGTGILGKEDFNNLPWDVVYLVTGGIVLGSAVESSKLLSIIVERLLYTLGDSHVWVTYTILCCFMATVANAVSHTVSAIIILPLVYEVGVKLGHPQLLVMGGTFAASSAMALPVSSFPNISVAQVTNEGGDSYLDTSDLLKVGIPMTIGCTLLIVTFGYWWMMYLGF